MNKLDRTSHPSLVLAQAGHMVNAIQKEGKYAISFPSPGNCVDTVCMALDKCPICPFPNLVHVFACGNEGK